MKPKKQKTADKPGLKKGKGSPARSKADLATRRGLDSAKSADQANPASERRLRALLEHGLDNISLLGANGDLLWESPATIRTLGYAPDEFVGRNILELIHPQDAAAVGQQFAELTREPEGVQRGSFRIKHSNGTWRWIELIASNLLADPAVHAIVINYRDVTERKLAQETLRESDERFQSAFEYAPIGMALVSPDGRWLRVNQALCNIVGYSNEELMTKTFQDISHPDDLGPDLNYIRRMLAGEIQTYQMEKRYFHKLGHTVWILLGVSVVRDDQGEPLYFISQIKDITQRKHAEQELRDSEERFRQLADNIDEVFWITEPQSNQDVYVSPAYKKVWGHLLKDVDDFVESVLPDDRSIVVAALEKQKHGRKTEIEYRILHADGSVRWVWDRAFPVFDETGKLIRVAGIAADVTERKHAESALALSESRFRTIVESEPECVKILGPDGTLLEMNPAGLKMIEADSLEQVKGLPMDKVVAPEYRTAFNDLTKRVLAGGSGTLEFEIIGLKGNRRWLETHAVPLKNADGIVTSLLGVTRDISARKHAENALREREERLRALFTILPVGVSIVDSRLTISETNPALEKIMSLSNEALLAGKHRNLRFIRKDGTPMPPEDFPSTRAMNEENEVLDVEIGILSGDKPTVWTQVSAAPLPGVGAVVVTADITERKLAEKAVHQYAAELESRVEERTAELTRANRAKDEFLAIMSHELRTPLSSILGLSETLLDGMRGSLNEQQGQAIELISSSGKHLLGLINDILDVSKIEAGKFDIHPETIAVEEICRASLIFVKELAVHKGITIEFDFVPGVSTILADARRLKQILVNLLSNAVKFTPENGTVRLEVQTDVEKNEIHFVIIDNGIGIAAENLQRLFKPFTQVDSSLSRLHEGSGLGLVLVHRLTEMHGGRVTVESEPGKGSRFTVVLPIHQKTIAGPPADISNAAPPPDGQKGTSVRAGAAPQVVPVDRGTVLLAEDNETNVLVLKDYLEYRGFDVVVAHNGVEVFSILERVTPRIILMDIQMPDMDGLEATRRLRATARFASIPIIALTAFAMPGDRERCLEAGANEYLSKPVGLKTLRQMIENFL